MIVNPDKHTSGPWKYSNRNWRNEETESGWYITGDHHDSIEENEDGQEVATPTCVSVAIVPRNSTSHPICEANARLIALAPEMLEALREASELLYSIYDHGGYSRAGWVYEQCRELLRKLEG